MRPLLVAAAMWILGSTSLAGTGAATAPVQDSPQSAKQQSAKALQAAQPFTDAIAALDKSDPGSPAALNGRLEYADFLVGAAGGECRERLDSSQAQLDTVAANPAVDVVLPVGRARLADLEYRIHTARASPSCGADQSTRESELREALSAAQSAVGLYRDALDYQSMAIMQFDVGVTQRMLGDAAAAVAALQATIDMDREYGFRDDARDNYKLLAQWSGRLGADAAAATAMQDFPTRKTTLKFGWSVGNTRVRLDESYAQVVDGRPARYQGSRSFKRTYREGLSEWVVSDEPGTVDFNFTDWPDKPVALHELVLSFERSLQQVPDFQVNKRGDFQWALGAQSLAWKLSTATRALFVHYDLSEPASSRVPESVARAVALAFAPQVIELRAAEDYNFETGAWIGATLEQGVWYKMSAPLALPGLVQVVLPHNVEFAYTHQVPCTADSTDRSCVEIVIRATPREDALQGFNESWTATLKLSHGRTAQYWSATYMRIVTDPNTLMTYIRDVRRYWHICDGGNGPDDVADESERLVSTSTYY